MNRWYWFDLEALFEDGAGTAGATTTANVAGFAVPFGGVLRPPSKKPKKDYEVAVDEFRKLLGKVKA